MEIYTYVYDKGNIPKSYEKIFAEGKSIIKSIAKKLDDDETNYRPKYRLIFRAFELTPFNTVKVVMVGQNPYPTDDDADGLAFSCQDRIPASLKAMLIERNNNYPKLFKTMPKTGDLSPWARQGILLLNRSLTTELGNPNYKVDMWRKFIDIPVRELIKRDKNIIWVLLGAKAQLLIKKIGSNGIIITAVHPSPKAGDKFYGSKIFLKVNQNLRKLGRREIDWSVGEELLDTSSESISEVESSYSGSQSEAGSKNHSESESKSISEVESSYESD
jgi:uracil-DNA glycosylase